MPIASAKINHGDTLVGLASRLMGDGARFRELVELNNLVPPYISATGGTGVLKPGDSLRYPASTLGPSQTSSELLEILTYKRGFKNPSDSTLSVINGTIERIGGLENLKQELDWRLRTPKGSHPAHPSYGSLLKTHVGKPVDMARLELIKSDIISCLQEDPRVERAIVNEISFRTQVVRAFVTIVPIPPGTTFEYDFSARL